MNDSTNDISSTWRLDSIADSVYLKILAHLTVGELLMVISRVSKRHHHLVSQQALWRQLRVHTLYADGSSQVLGINGQMFINPPHHFFARLRAVPLFLHTLRIEMSYKHQQRKALLWTYELVTEHLSLRRAFKVEFWSTDSGSKRSINETKVFGEVLRRCLPCVLHTECAVVPRVIPREARPHIRELFVSGRGQKHFEFDAFCSVLASLNNLEVAHIHALYGRYTRVTREELSRIEWPSTLRQLHFKGNPVDEHHASHSKLEFFWQDVRVKCPHLRVFG